MPRYETTEKTPRFWRGRPTPEPGTVVEMTEVEAEYEVKLGILRPHTAKAGKKQAGSASSKRDGSETGGKAADGSSALQGVSEPKAG